MGFTTTVMVAIVPHCPAFGVKVYTVEPALAVLMVAGFHVPVMPFVEVVGRVPGVAPTQYGPRWVKVGVTEVLTTTIIVPVVPHCPALGVKVYTVDPALAVLMVAGFQVPVMPFSEVVGNIPGVAPTQYGPNCVNVGVTVELTTTVIVTTVAH